MTAYSRKGKGGPRSGSSRPFFTAHSLAAKGASRRPHSSSGTRRAYSPASGGGSSAVRAQSASRRKNQQPGIKNPGAAPGSYRYTYFGNDRKRRVSRVDCALRQPGLIVLQERDGEWGEVLLLLLLCL